MLEWLPEEIQDMILLYCSKKDILNFGKENVSRYIWYTKQYTCLTDACYAEAYLTGNITSIKYLIQIANKNDFNDA
jgi:hypothetical protein